MLPSEMEDKVRGQLHGMNSDRLGNVASDYGININGCSSREAAIDRMTESMKERSRDSRGTCWAWKLYSW